MFSKYGIPILAAGMLLFALNHVVKARQTPSKLPPPVEPARSPYKATLAGSGIVEPETENISIGSHLPGIVDVVRVKVGAKVKAGEVLFRLDDRQFRAELALREANLAAAQAQLDRLKALPREEELPGAEFKVREAQATVDSWNDQFERAKKLYAKNAVGEEELNKLRNTRQAAIEQRERVRAELDLLKAGAWAPEKAVSEAAVGQVKAQIEQTRTEIERLSMRAPVDGEVLQLNVRTGEFVGAAAGTALIVLGDIDRLHVRVDIDENDIHRFKSTAAAVARLRGDPRQEFKLKFVRIEPFVIPKKSLAGVNTERVDTRVLQVIYAIDGPSPRVYVGQQLDVFLDAGE